MKRETHIEFNLGSRKQIGEYLIDAGWNLRTLHLQVNLLLMRATLSRLKKYPKQR